MKTASLLATLLALSLAPAGFADKPARKAPAPGKPASEKSAEPARSKPETPPGPAGMKIICEWIEIEHADLTDYLFDNKLDNDATPFRREIQSWIKDDRASVVRTVLVTARSGQRAKVESIEEHIYATEYDPAEVPSLDISLDEAEIEIPVTTANPAAFETRNVGATVEVDPVFDYVNGTIDLNLSPELVYRLDDIVYHEETDEIFRVIMPLFYTAKVTTQVNCQNGGYVLIGTVTLPEPHNDDREDPVVLLFVRADAD